MLVMCIIAGAWLLLAERRARRRDKDGGSE
jgi:hypothetical protein